jgi:hypothetical protein
MKNRILVLLIAVVSFGAAGPLMAAEDIVEQVATGCASEIEQYCSQVVPGNGRLVACFFAHEDKLSGQCQYALYDASAQLEHAVSALNYLASQCKADIDAHCAGIQPGEGLILECLDKKSESVSSKCTQAIADVVE